MDNNDSRVSRHKKRPKKRKNKTFKIIMSILVVVALILVSAIGYTYFTLGKIKGTKLSKNNSDLGISNKASSLDNSVTNIALYGLDRREKNEASRSDSIIIASIDNKNKKVKLSSIMRDAYVNVPGYGQTKITHAYAYGGPQLSIKTLNSNFNLNIKDYATVDFFGLEKIIDKLGGVTIDVQSDEIQYINSYMRETAGLEKESIPTVTHAGSQTLNGIQAVAYSRIRYVGNDFERTDRQRRVLSQLFDKVQAGGLSSYSSTVNELLPYTETSLSSTQILALGTGIFTKGIKTIEQQRFPVDGYWQNLMVGGVYYLGIDIPSTTQQLYNFIYNDQVPQPKK